MLFTVEDVSPLFQIYILYTKPATVIPDTTMSTLSGRCHRRRDSVTDVETVSSIRDVVVIEPRTPAEASCRRTDLLHARQAQRRSPSPELVLVLLLNPARHDGGRQPTVSPPDLPHPYPVYDGVREVDEHRQKVDQIELDEDERVGRRVQVDVSG